MSILHRIKSFFFITPVTDRERGRDYAKRKMASGRPPSELLQEADNPFDFNDFDRGVIDAVREHNRVKDRQ